MWSFQSLWPVLIYLLLSCSSKPGFGPAAATDEGLDYAAEIDSTNAAEIDAWRAEKIRDAFAFAMDGYFQFAFPKDELRPLNNTGVSNRVYGCGWGLSVVDALGTAIVMELEDVVEKSLDFIDTIDFTSTPTNNICRLFEVNIRYVGGLLSAYDLLTGPFAHLAQNTDVKYMADHAFRTVHPEKSRKIDRLLEQTKSLADTFKFAFDTPTGLPRRNVYLNNRSFGMSDEDDDVDLTNAAEAGTLILEWTRLSDLTGDPEYAALVNRAESNLLRPKNPAIGEPLPGLISFPISILNGSFTSSFGGWIGGVDSYYEYLIKMYCYDPSRFSYLKDEWVQAADSTIKYLTSHPSTAPEITWLAEHNRTLPSANGSLYLIPSSQHLACFAGGSFLLGGAALAEPRYVDYGLQLAQACRQLYAQTATRLGPLAWSWLDPRITNDTAGGGGGGQVRPVVPAAQAAFYARAGFFITDNGTAIGAEALESWYYAHRATGDRAWLDYAWDYFVAQQRYQRVGSGFSPFRGVDDDDVVVRPPPGVIPPGVNVSAGALGRYENLQPSFFLAETLKYQYLAHRPDLDVGFANRAGPEGQMWVFTTEAHLIRTMNK